MVTACALNRPGGIGAPVTGSPPFTGKVLVCGRSSCERRRADERHRMGIMVLDSKSSERRSTATLPLTWQDGHERRQRGCARRVLRPRDGGK